MKAFDRKKKTNDTDRTLMLVINRHELMFALQIKKTLLCHKKVDIVLEGELLGSIYDRHILESMFSRVYFSPIKAPRMKEQLLFFLFPERGVIHYIAADPGEYEKVFFWNPTWLYYYLFKYSIKRHHNYKWHLMTDGLSCYMTDGPGSCLIHSNSSFGKILNHIDRKKWGLDKGPGHTYDIYVTSREYVVHHPEHELVDVPLIDIEDQEWIGYLNQVFAYEHHDIEYPIVFLDTLSEGWFDERLVIDCLRFILKEVGKNSIIIKKHPRDSFEKYDSIKDDVVFMEDDIPWELVYLNGGIKGKTIIGIHSSALIMPNILLGLDEETYTLNKIIPITKQSLGVDFITNYNKLFDIVQSRCNHFYQPESIEQLTESVRERVGNGTTIEQKPYQVNNI